MIPRLPYADDDHPRSPGTIIPLPRPAAAAPDHYNQEMDTPPCRITVSRRHGKDVRDRQIIVSLDGEPLATLLFGEEVTRQIGPGAHRLRAHNTLFWKTGAIELEPGEHARFVVVNEPGFGTYSLLGLLGAGPLYLTFDRVTSETP
jgi:hypothetical protein